MLHRRAINLDLSSLFLALIPATLPRGALKLLYVAPEKLLTPAVLQALLKLPQGISLVGMESGVHTISVQVGNY